MWCLSAFRLTRRLQISSVYNMMSCECETGELCKVFSLGDLSVVVARFKYANAHHSSLYFLSAAEIPRDLNSLQKPKITRNQSKENPLRDTNSPNAAYKWNGVRVELRNTSQSRSFGPRWLFPTSGVINRPTDLCKMQQKGSHNSTDTKETENNIMRIGFAPLQYISSGKRARLEKAKSIVNYIRHKHKYSCASGLARTAKYRSSWVLRDPFPLMYSC